MKWTNTFKRCTIAVLFLGVLFSTQAQTNLYYPPILGGQWDTITPLDAGWCDDDLTDLYTFLDTTNTRAFIVLHQGKRVIEQYFHGFKADSVWYWASAGKSLTAFLVGLAQQQGHLDISDPVSQYLGNQWTACTPAEESAITIEHQLAMTTGFDDGVPNLNCISNVCLQCMATPGTRWSYHNAPYTLLRDVLEDATGLGINQYVFQQLTQTTGMTGIYAWLPDDLNVFFSNARSMARFGLLMLSNGRWNSNTIMSDQQYFNQMITASQAENEAYGFLWWLNNTSTYMAPYLRFQFQGNMSPASPNDMYSALGKNGQIINVIPSADMVVVRMGENPDTNVSVPWNYNDAMMAHVSQLICDLSIDNLNDRQRHVSIQFMENNALRITSKSTIKHVRQYDMRGVDVGSKQVNFANDYVWNYGRYGIGAFVVVVETVDGVIHRQKVIVTN